MIDEVIDEELEIRQMFLEEAQEYVDTMDDGLVGIDSQSSTFRQQMDMILRAAHSLKGAAGIMQFHELSETAHRFEDSLKIIKSNHPQIDLNCERLLLNAVGLLREIILINRQGKVVSPVWLQKFNIQIFEPLEAYLSSTESHAVDDIPEAEVDIATLIFEQEINGMLVDLEAKLDIPNFPDLIGELQNIASEFSDLGEMLELPNFINLNKAIAQKITEINPDRVTELAVSALEAWRRSQALVMEGNKENISSEFDFDRDFSQDFNQSDRQIDSQDLDAISEGFDNPHNISDIDSSFIQGLDDLSVDESYIESISLDNLEDLISNQIHELAADDRLDLDGDLDEDFNNVIDPNSLNESFAESGSANQLDDLLLLDEYVSEYENSEESILPEREDLDSLFDLLADQQINHVINQLPIELTFSENITLDFIDPNLDPNSDPNFVDIDNPFDVTAIDDIDDVLEGFNPFDFIEDSEDELRDENFEEDIFSSDEILLEVTPIDAALDRSFASSQEVSQALAGENLSLSLEQIPDIIFEDSDTSDNSIRFDIDDSNRESPLSDESLLDELFDTFIQENYAEDDRESNLDLLSQQMDLDNIDDSGDRFIDISIAPLPDLEISTETLDSIDDELFVGFDSNSDSLKQENQDTLTDLFANFFNATPQSTQSLYIPEVTATKTLGMNTANDLFDSFLNYTDDNIEVPPQDLSVWQQFNNLGRPEDTSSLLSTDINEISLAPITGEIAREIAEQNTVDDLFADFLDVTDSSSKSIDLSEPRISQKEDISGSGIGKNLSQYVRESQPHEESSLPETLDDLQEDLEISGDIPAIPDRVSDLVATYVKDTSIRIPVSRIEQLHDLSGEMIVGHNSLDMQIKQLRQLLKSLHGRIRTLENANSQLSVVYDRMTTEASTNKPINRYATVDSNDIFAELNNFDYSADFDSLELDSYNELHSLSQSVSEAIVQLQEVVEDVDLSLDETAQNASSLNSNFRQLQSAIKETKMRPLRDIVGRFPRVIRSLGLQYDKSVEVVLNGVDLLIEQTILDAITDPLNHLLRNAFDHGIEDRNIRSQKNSQGKIEITAKQLDRKILITVSDNGRGIDPQKIKAKALRSLDALRLTQAQVESMSEEQLIQLIFAPEFTTTDKVTSLSGRGVGMDVVKTNLQQIGAEIYTETELGVGTTFTLAIPYTLVALRITLIEVNHTIVGIPTDLIQEVLPIDEDLSLSSMRYQNSDIPIFPLDRHLQINCARRDLHLEDKPSAATKSILVLNFEQKLWGIYVNGCWGEQEVTLRQPLGMPLPDMFVGCAIVSTGQSVPILATQVLNQNFVKITLDRVDNSSNSISNVKNTQTSQSSILVVDDSVNVRRYLALVLKKAGFKVDQAIDGEDAIAKLTTNLEEGMQVDVVLSDVEMPRLDGYGLLARIKGEPKLQTLPVVMLTSRSGDKHRELAINLGASEYFTKPFNEDDLIQCLRSLTLKED